MPYPMSSQAYLDRRTVTGETAEAIKAEMESIIAGKNATWEIKNLHRKSWTGMDIKYKPFHLAWEIDPDHKLSRTCAASYRQFFGKEPGYDYWDFSTNAVTPVSMGIPSIGFGPGIYKLAHCPNENCAIEKILEACGFYITLINNL